MHKSLATVWNFFDPAAQGSAYTLLKRSKKRKSSGLFSFGIRRRLAYSR